MSSVLFVTVCNNCYLLIAYILIFSIFYHQPAWSTNWKSLGTDWYADVDSAEKYGDIATIKVRYKHEFLDIMFDCKRKIIISPDSWVDNIIIKNDGSHISKIYKFACIKWYEIWK